MGTLGPKHLSYEYLKCLLLWFLKPGSSDGECIDPVRKAPPSASEGHTGPSSWELRLETKIESGHQDPESSMLVQWTPYLTDHRGSKYPIFKVSGPKYH